MKRLLLAVMPILAVVIVGESEHAAAQAPVGFVSLFNGRDLTGWKVPEGDKGHWKVVDGVLFFDGDGENICTAKDCEDFELLVDWKIGPAGDSCIFLRGCPQVQIIDYTYEPYLEYDADKGSGGLWNNSRDAPGKDPLVLADKPVGEWNHFRIVMVSDRVSVWLNDQLVVDHAVMENYYDRKQPVPPRGPISLQTHGGEIRWRSVFVREIGAEEARRILSRLPGRK